MSGKRKRLEAAVTAIQQRWGRPAVQQGSRLDPTLPAIPTSFAALDAALDGCHGIPRQRITELLGAPTSGMATIALKVMAQAQQMGDTAAYLDLNQTFDPDYAARCGVILKRLLLVRPHSGTEALEMSDHLLRQRGVGLLIFDSVTALHATPLNPSALNQLTVPLSRSTAALLFLTPLQYGGAMSKANYPPHFALPHLAGLRLALSKEKWIHRGRDVRGYQARVRILKNKLGRAGRQVSVSITFNGTVRGDAT